MAREASTDQRQRMNWRMSHRFDRECLPLADRHYSRQKPGTPQFVAPGRCLVLKACHPVRALWVTSWPMTQYTKHEWAGAWVCSMFRNEGAGLSSSLIREAVAATLHHYGTAPELGMVTFVKPAAVASRNPGYCFRCAGFERVGRTKRHKLIAFQMLPSMMPDPAPAIRPQVQLFG